MLYAHDTGYFLDPVWEYLASRKDLRLGLVSLDCTHGWEENRQNHMGFTAGRPGPLAGLAWSWVQAGPGTPVPTATVAPLPLLSHHTARRGTLRGNTAAPGQRAGHCWSATTA